MPSTQRIAEPKTGSMAQPVAAPRCGVSPGPSSREGLTWLARVGPAPLGVSRGIAMGWGQAAVYSHARRLRERGWLATCSRPRGEGSLVYASRRGVRELGVQAAAMKTRPTPVTWAHWEACSWTAAWLTARGREMIAPREILVDAEWSGELASQSVGSSAGEGTVRDLRRLPARRATSPDRGGAQRDSRRASRPSSDCTPGGWPAARAPRSSMSAAPRQ